MSLIVHFQNYFVANGHISCLRHFTFGLTSTETLVTDGRAIGLNLGLLQF